MATPLSNVDLQHLLDDNHLSGQNYANGLNLSDVH